MNVFNRTLQITIFSSNFDKMLILFRDPQIKMKVRQLLNEKGIFNNISLNITILTIRMWRNIFC